MHDDGALPFIMLLCMIPLFIIILTPTDYGTTTVETTPASPAQTITIGTPTPPAPPWKGIPYVRP